MLTPCVEPVGGEEHGEEEHDPWVVAEGSPEAEQLSLPRRVDGLVDLRAVRPDHLRCRDHAHRDEDTEARKDKECGLEIASVCLSAWDKSTKTYVGAVSDCATLQSPS